MVYGQFNPTTQKWERSEFNTGTEIIYNEARREWLPDRPPEVKKDGIGLEFSNQEAVVLIEGLKLRQANLEQALKEVVELSRRIEAQFFS